MKQIDCKSWDDFEVKLRSYLTGNAFFRENFIFRGLASSKWNLETTLDRAYPTLSSEDQLSLYERLITDFRQECLGLPTPRFDSNDGEEEFELLARHHGLPSPILDWTRSPYIASFFAFSDPIHDTSSPPEKCSILMLNRVRAFTVDDSEVRKSIAETVIEINDQKLIRNNQRAIEQRSIFFKILTNEEKLEDLLSDSIFRFNIPTTDRRYALNKLEEVGINFRSLFRDLDSAAKTVSLRYMLKENTNE